MSLEQDWTERLGGAADGAKAGAGIGATLGSVVPGVGTVIGGGVGAAVGGLVGLARAWTGQPHGDDETPALAEAAQAITGVADQAQQVALLAADPVKAEEFRIEALRVRADAERARMDHLLALVRAADADRQAARGQTAALAATGSKLAWGAAVVTLIIFGLFGYAVVMGPDISPDLKETLKVMVVAASSYWIGSSAGSAAKDRRLAAEKDVV